MTTTTTTTNKPWGNASPHPRTTTLANGTKVVRRKIVDTVLEWRLQAASVTRLRRMRGYGTRFDLAGDMNAGKRGPQAQMQAKATGLEPGEPDLRIYVSGGTLRMIEYKGANGRVSDDQKRRHALLKSLGFDVVIVQASTEDEAADRTEELVKAWIGAAANDN